MMLCRGERLLHQNEPQVHGTVTATQVLNIDF